MASFYPFQLLNTGIIDMDYLQGTFSERQELDSYEQMWHTYIYQPSWSELKTEVSNTSMLACIVFDVETALPDPVFPILSEQALH